MGGLKVVSLINQKALWKDLSYYLSFNLRIDQYLVIERVLQLANVRDDQEQIEARGYVFKRCFGLYAVFGV